MKNKAFTVASYTLPKILLTLKMRVSKIIYSVLLDTVKFLLRSNPLLLLAPNPFQAPSQPHPTKPPLPSPTIPDPPSQRPPPTQMTV